MQTDRGHEQARAGGEQIRNILQSEQEAYKLFFYMSPYKRSKQTYEGIAAQFGRHIVAGTQEEVQLREQDFGNFQVSCCLASVMQALSSEGSSCGNRTLAGSRAAAVWHLSCKPCHRKGSANGQLLHPKRKAPVVFSYGLLTLFSAAFGCMENMLPICSQYAPNFLICPQVAPLHPA